MLTLFMADVEILRFVLLGCHIDPGFMSANESALAFVYDIYDSMTGCLYNLDSISNLKITISNRNKHKTHLPNSMSMIPRKV